jgi:L-cysteine desulfidase
MAALHLMGKANTSANLSAIFNAKAEQAKLAQAKGDKVTVNKLRKELLELNLQIFNDNKWMIEQLAQVQTPVVTEKQEDLLSTQIRTSEKQTSEFGEQIDVLIAQIRSLRDRRRQE